MPENKIRFERADFVLVIIQVIKEGYTCNHMNTKAAIVAPIKGPIIGIQP